MPMTFKEAKAKLIATYGSRRYLSMYYELNLDGDGNERQRCRIYLAHATSTDCPGPGSDWCDNWEDAFVSLAEAELKMAGVDMVVVDSTGAPE